MREDSCPKMKITNCAGCNPFSCPWGIWKGWGCSSCNPCLCPPGPRGPAGPAGEAATIQIGTVTTGAPGTPAEVTNSGTAQNAVLNFVIPQGEPGGETPPNYLTAYSLPAQPGASGSPIVFDRNASSSGTAVTHENNSPDIVIQQPGYYAVSFHGTVSATSDNSFPFSELLYLDQNGSPVTGTGARQSFESAGQSANLSFTQIIPVTNVPTTLNVVGEGGNVLYSDASITVNRVGSLT